MLAGVTADGGCVRDRPGLPLGPAARRVAVLSREARSAAYGGDERVVLLVFHRELRGVVATQPGHPPSPLGGRVGDLVARVTHSASVSLREAQDALSRVFPGRGGGAGRLPGSGRALCELARGRGRHTAGYQAHAAGIPAGHTGLTCP